MSTFHPKFLAFVSRIFFLENVTNALRRFVFLGAGGRTSGMGGWGEGGGASVPVVAQSTFSACRLTASGARAHERGREREREGRDSP